MCYPIDGSKRATKGQAFYFIVAVALALYKLVVVIVCRWTLYGAGIGTLACEVIHGGVAAYGSAPGRAAEVAVAFASCTVGLERHPPAKAGIGGC